jgi:hypothetical protein
VCGPAAHAEAAVIVGFLYLAAALAFLVFTIWFFSPVPR